ncbi:hypothetical protein EYF80_047557 [Liparis tanakae]|uniref:Uncharacterized protein n=1 Tax=Liparis tanakae TaxID=230148 RepID=A0A4Z2FPK9_9TELE|nr:hypothetical protein EYF80_047557 [Liparis tanakae]
MSLKRGFFPALQSLQNQLPFGISILRHSRWNAAGQDSQHSRLPPGGREEQLHQPLRAVKLGHEHPPSPLSEARQKQFDDHRLKRASFGPSPACSSVRTFGADEAPADVDVFVVLDAAARGEVVGTDDAVVGEHDAARRHAEVRGVVGHRAAHAPDQATCGPTHKTHAVKSAERRKRAAMEELLGLAMKQVRQTWMEQRKPRFTGAVGAKLAMHSPW